MKPKQSKSAFSKLLEADGMTLSNLTATQGIAQMLLFYADHRAAGCNIEEDGDMLLYQWGPDHDEEMFQLDITRQFIVPDEDEPYQLSLTFHYELTTERQKIEDGNEWCSAPDDLASFRQFIEKSPAYRAVANKVPKRVELNFGAC